MSNYVYVLTSVEVGDWDVYESVEGVFSNSDLVLNYLQNECFCTDTLDFTQLSPTLEHEREFLSVYGYHQKPSELFKDEEGLYYTLGWCEDYDEVYHDYHSFPRVWFRVKVMKVDKLCVS